MEIWKEIDGFKNYQVSNLGNVRNKEKLNLRKPFDNGYGYLFVRLRDDNNAEKNKTIHSLVAIAFLNHIPCGHKLVINHKDHNRHNNNLDNLEVITTRQNVSNKKLTSSSKYIGVYWNKKRNKWISRIRIGNTTKYLGQFENELDASIAYKNKLNEIQIIK